MFDVEIHGRETWRESSGGQCGDLHTFTLMIFVHVHPQAQRTTNALQKRRLEELRGGNAPAPFLCTSNPNRLTTTHILGPATAKFICLHAYRNNPKQNPKHRAKKPETLNTRQRLLVGAPEADVALELVSKNAPQVRTQGGALEMCLTSLT